ncbi:hypothetical protein EUGRSUZ_B02595 [Eucalyptus grandis]|uniref:Uncharacterized protein n=2 Tax=Eucalyptus grandis TaxID=71139 RepID=A0ACC3LVE6_EUCGR|nr:hypothetical protein EUGRSUZ_B02595 [Eucalyptus grandis]
MSSPIGRSAKDRERKRRGCESTGARLPEVPGDRAGNRRVEAARSDGAPEIEVGDRGGGGGGGGAGGARDNGQCTHPMKL